MKKKIIIGIAGVILLGGLGLIGNSQTEVAGVSTKVTSTPTPKPTLTLTPTQKPTLTPTQAPTPTSTPRPTATPTPTIIYIAPTTQTYQQTTNDSSGLSNDNYYTNSEGNKVHSPAYSDTVPAGASAKCGDGTYSFSQSRRGTCSSHGGVSVWY